jgi:tetratricopeptide (TPR) repeat protein
MKTLTVVALFAIAISTAQIDAQGRPRGTGTRVEVPTFSSAEAALSWGKAQLVSARNAGGTPAGKTLLMQAASASKLAQEWKNVATETQVEAALTGVEAFLGLDAPLNAQAVMARVRREDVGRSSFAAVVLERSGEAAELLGDRGSAFLGYQKGLAALPAPDWKSLLLYRAGIGAFHQGDSGKAAAILEEALGVLPEESRRASVAEVALGRAYVNLKDRSRAEAWLTKATRALDRRARGAPAAVTEVQTFIPEPSDGELRKQIAAAEAALKDPRR